MSNKPTEYVVTEGPERPLWGQPIGQKSSPPETLRDKFAGQIAAAMIHDDGVLPDPSEKWDGDNTFADHIAKTAYAFADALMKARM